jgi:hypothetical protein
MRATEVRAGALIEHLTHRVNDSYDAALRCDAAVIAIFA